MEIFHSDALRPAANARFRKIAEFIQKKIAKTGTDRCESGDLFTYRWQHTMRVSQYGLQLAREEHADPELCVSACLLHDLARFEVRDHGVEHGREGARQARPLLKELGYSPAEVENICFSVAVHVDDRADFEHPMTIEAQVVNDADNIDRFSAYRILASFDKSRPDYDKMIYYAEKRLVTLNKYRHNSIMATPSGNALFNKQLDLQILFIERFLAESKLTRLPEL